MAELPNIKPGDRVRAEFVVDGVSELGVWGPVQQCRYPFVRFEHITEIIPAPKAIKVGDRVKINGTANGFIVVIKAISADGWALIEYDDNSRGASRLSDLTLIEDETATSGQQERPRP